MTSDNPFEGLVLADELRLMPPDLRARLTPQDIQDYIDKGADIYARDQKGNTALMWAVTRCSPATVAFFIGKGLGVNDASPEKGTPFLWAAYTKGFGLGQKRKILRLLLENGANPAATDRAGKDAETLAREFCGEEHAAAVREEVAQFRHEQEQHCKAQQLQKKLKAAAPRPRFKT